MTVSAFPAALDRLSECYGIEAEFVDARGETQRTTGETKRALLTALGVACDDDALTIASLAAFDAAAWDAILPPVAVVLDDAVAVPVVLPVPGGDLQWCLTLEDGRELRGEARFDGLPLLETNGGGASRRERRRLIITGSPGIGYHHLSLVCAGQTAHTSLVVTPGRCWLPPSIVAGEKLGGIAVQVGLLRSNDDWGIGDFGSLRRFVAFTAEHGADVVGLNPLHEMFPDEPERASPYSPASRLTLNALAIDVGAIPEFAACEAAQRRASAPEFIAAIERSRAAKHVDYATVATLKLPVLEDVFAAFDHVATPERRAAFNNFRAGAAPAVERTYRYSALRRHVAATGGAAGWPDWPPQFRDPASPAVERFAREHASDVAFFAWLQWIAETQFAAVAAAAAPMRVGLYRDLAVGPDPAGAETWADAEAVVHGAHIGAPPDIYNPAGQDWQLPAFHPQRLREHAYRSFRELVRTNMRHAGALRIDHAMALRRLYLIPEGRSPAEGAYVRYPLDDMIGILALESHRAQCLVVGEDLGTVPEGFRERLAASNILSYRVVFFEREDRAEPAFISPDAYPQRSLAVLGSHDLPTLAAWWSGADIDLREGLALLDPAAARAQRELRTRERSAFEDALVRAKILTPASAIDADAAFAAAHAFLAGTSAALAIAQIDDVTGEIDPVNVPTTSEDVYPNWRRRLARTIEELQTDGRFALALNLFANGRAAGRSATAKVVVNGATDVESTANAGS